MPTLPTTVGGEGWHSKNAGTEYFYPYEESDEEDLTDAGKQAYESASFQSPDQYLFPTEATSDHMLESWEQKFEAKPAESSGTTQVRTYLLRSSLEVQAQASPAAPAEAQRTVTVFLYKGSTDLDNLEKTGTITFSKTNVDFTGALTDHCKPSGVGKVKIERKLEKDPKNESNNDKITSTNQHFYLQLMSVGIEPEAGMAGVIGDIVKPANAGSRVRHFVTPKKSTELAQPYVELKAEGADETQFSELFQWEYEGNGQIGSAANKFRVKRDAPGLTKVKIKTRHDGVVVDEMHVWVVWCDLVPAPATGTTAFLPVTGGALFSVSTLARYAWRFRFTINPAIIITDAERPGLEGKLPNIPQAAVPGASNTWPTNPQNSNGEPITGDSAEYKWDVSRQMRLTFENPALVSQSDLDGSGGNSLWTQNQNPPMATQALVNFPNGDAEGNDDPLKNASGNPVMDEEDDPYNDHSSIGVGRGHPVGQLSSVDAPGFAMPNSWGGNGRSFVKRAEFREFARLHIWDGTRESGQFWYRVSDFYPWQHLMRAVWDEDAQQWKNNGSIPTPIPPP